MINVVIAKGCAMGGAVVFAMLSCLGSVMAQEPASGVGPATGVSSLPAAEPASESPSRWLLVCCGLPGDDEHRQRLTDACRKIMHSSEHVIGCAPERIQLLVGDAAMHDALQNAAGDLEVCTRQSIEAALEQLGQQVRADDQVWVILLGHAHLYESHSWFNVSGPDLDQDDFARWAESIGGREQVYWLTFPVSGFWIKPLSRDGRVVITATEPDLEYTGTEMPYALADVLSGTATYQNLEDIDGDDQTSLLDLYLTTCIELAERFRVDGQLQTEHARLEDNGDGRGTEIQAAFLPTPAEDEATDEAPATPPRPEPIRNQSLDGFRSRQILLTPASVQDTPVP